jgi:thioredoxin-dependent peroxiredoxin
MNFGVAKVSARHTFLIDPDGVVRKVFLDVKPQQHSEEVLAALSELQAGASK